MPDTPGAGGVLQGALGGLRRLRVSGYRVVWEQGLMDLALFRRDEFWFVEKDTDGRSRLHSMNDYRPRNDLDVQKAYLNGRFGGVPILAE